MVNQEQVFGIVRWLAATGIARDKVTHVLMTHLHADHIGWCTTLDNGKWVPTFPNARYIMPKIDFDYFGAQRGTKGPLDDGSFGDSIDPVVQAGLANFITADQRDILGLRITKAPGHTPGMLNFWLESRGETGVFSADVFHHPAQIYYPDWNTAFCVLQDESKLLWLRRTCRARREELDVEIAVGIASDCVVSPSA